MKKKDLKLKIADLEEKLCHLKPPSTKVYFHLIDLWKDEQKFFKIQNVYLDEERREIINERIAETINKYGLMKFEGKKLYDITLIYDLKKAIILIENGMVDYYRQKQSKVDYNSDTMLYKKQYVDENKIDKIYYAKKARERAVTQKEYDDLLHIFISYAEEKLFFDSIEDEIRDCINISGIDKYLGTSLWEIKDIKLYQEAQEAICNMHELKTIHGITEHNGTPVEELSNYELDGILQTQLAKKRRKKAA